jgi:hypothetical protein
MKGEGVGRASIHDATHPHPALRAGLSLPGRGVSLLLRWEQSAPFCPLTRPSKPLSNEHRSTPGVPVVGAVREPPLQHVLVTVALRDRYARRAARPNDARRTGATGSIGPGRTTVPGHGGAVVLQFNDVPRTTWAPCSRACCSGTPNIGAGTRWTWIRGVAAWFRRPWWLQDFARCEYQHRQSGRGFRCVKRKCGWWLPGVLC